MLGEMLFGSIPMSSNGPIIKVHTFKMPPKVMLSRVFQLKPPNEQLETDGGDKDSISLYCADMTIPRSISANSLPSVEIARSMPIAMPTSPNKLGLDDESGEFSASGSFLAPFLPSSPGSVSSSASNGSLHRRWLRNQVTSMENVARRRSSENISNVEEPIRRRKRYPKIGVAILFNLPEQPSGREDEEFRRFFFSHFSLLEGHFQRLVSSIEKALNYHRKSFIRPVMEALDHFKLSVIQLYTSPRIQRPIWLNLMTYPQQRGHLCEHLIRELGRVLETHNSKQNNFFMSRLMTGVLMYHLAWVPTVMPAGATPSRAFLDKHSSTTLDILAKCHPYNPLWAQLGDMYGNIGLPNRVAKTVIVGKRADVVCRLLYVLSYFIRCSEVHEINEKCEDIIMECTQLALSESDDSIDRRRTLTEDMFLAKTEDSGIEDVGGLTQSESSNKPVFYIQDMPKHVETSSDDGVGLEGESQEGVAVRKLRCIQERNKNRTNVILSNNSNSRTHSRFEESDDVFRDSTDSRTTQLNKVVGGGDTCKVAETVAKSNSQSVQHDQEPSIVCKTLDNSLLVSKLEVAVPVGRASRNIEDLLKFDIDEPLTAIDSSKDSNDRTLNSINDCNENDKFVISKLANEKFSNSHESGESVSKPDIVLSTEHNADSNHHVLKSHKVSDSIDITTSPCQRTVSPPSKEHVADATQHRLTPSHTSSNHSGQAIGQNQHQMCRLESIEDKGRYERSSDLYKRSVSSMSAVSCASSALSDHTCLEHEELPLACSEQMFELELEKNKSHVDNFGRSLLGGYCQNFVPDFALQGVPKLDNKLVEKSLIDSSQHPVLDDSVLEDVYLVADTDNWSVETVSCERYQGCSNKPVTQDVGISGLVDQLLESVMQLHRMKLSSDFCLMHLEDRLQEVYFQSTSVASYLEHKPMIKAKALAGAVGVDCTDLPLLLAVASVHSPHVIANVVRETIEQQRLLVQQDSP
ncbi:folliculin-interacting protein 2-like [Lytechinus variegatus]|uniref:folliculin-interacting protein 2-like n=1 Tax=Lytechinus variegatus TaxID=7654 RepID=UPI001BB2195D|nr:folliculin-interacting protein 2-like [Lytechinus variegatus]